MNSAVRDTPPTEVYHRHLDTFVERCRRLTAGGQPYMTVVLCHELFRMLYPADPYADFTHTDPVGFLVRHIAALIDLARAAEEGVTGYSDVFAASSPPAVDAPLERRTSDLYSDLWQRLDREALVEESRRLLSRRLPDPVLAAHVVGRRVLDMGCGSGRYSVAMAALGAAHVTAVDFQARSFAAAQTWCRDNGLAVSFETADVLNLAYPDQSFDFVLSNGVLHHTRSWRQGLAEMIRVMRSAGYLYLYGSGGFFWTTRRAMRTIMADIPREYAQKVLDLIGMPRNRFIFMDSWYVPVEEHLTRHDVEATLRDLGVAAERLPSAVETDVGWEGLRAIPGAADVWGEGEHRYLTRR